jgi:hypothetical protein
MRNGDGPRDDTAKCKASGKYNREIASVSSVIEVTPTEAGSGVTRSVLIIGDSTTANGTVVAKLNENFRDDPMNIVTIGTKGTAPNNHEGIGGWTVNKWRTSPERNPFYNDAKSEFDFAYFMKNQGFASADYVIINLCINDMFRFWNDSALEGGIAQALEDYEFRIGSIHAYQSDIRIGVAVTIPPHYSQDAFGRAYQTLQTRWRYKRNLSQWTKALIERFQQREPERIYLVPIHTNLDTRHNMGAEPLPVNARNPMLIDMPLPGSGVHPAESGYWQIADVYWYWLKSFES